MLYRDDLYQANRHVEELEAQLRGACADRDQLARARVEPVVEVPDDSPKCWALVVVFAGAIAYFAGLRTGWFAFLVPSAIFGAALCSIDVWIRSHNGNRSSAWGRLATVLGAIVAAPAAVLVGGITAWVVYSIIEPIFGILLGLYMVAAWIVRRIRGAA